MPQGALVTAKNVVINREDIIEPRRGFKIYGNAMGTSATTDFAHQLFIYKNRLLRHFGTGAGTTLQWDDGSGTFTSFSGTWLETISGLRMKGMEINGNFYATTSTGIRKISAASAAAMGSATVGDAGVIKALDGEAVLNTQEGFFTQDSTISYRIVWGIKDFNNNVILGTPSERIIITDPISDLLITNFNTLLVNLDDVSNSGGINDGDYVSTLKVPLNSSASFLRTKLLSLSQKIDDDTIITEGAINTATTQRTTVTNVEIIFNSSVATFLEVGDKLNCTGFATSELNNNILTIVSVVGTTINATPFTNFSGTDGAPVVDVGGVVQRLKYTLLTSPVTLSDTPTTTQLESLQDYYDTIITNLQDELTGIITDTTPFDILLSTQSQTVDITFTVPIGVTTSHFYQIYRTNLATSTGTSTLSDQDPGDEHKLAFEENPTGSEITAKSITVHDIVPESFLGANLYTNPVSGEGIAQANEIPPFAKDIALFKGFTFYANTKTKHRLDLSLLSVTNLVSEVSKITTTNGTISNTYTFVSPQSEISDVDCVAFASVPADSYYFLNSAKNKNKYYVWQNKGGGTDPAISGRIGIEVDISATVSANDVAEANTDKLNQYDDFTVSVLLDVVTIENAETGIADDSYDAGGTTFTITTTQQGKGENSTSVTRTGDTLATNPTITNLSTTIDLEIGMWVTGTGIPSNSQIISKTATTVTLNNNASLTNSGVSLTFVAKRILISDAATPSQQVDETARSLVRVINKQVDEIINSFYLSGPDDVPGEFLLEARGLSDTAFYVNADTTTTGEQFSPTIPTSGNTVISTNEISPNRIYVSKNSQPEAVPLLNYQDVGPKDKEILRIIALRDSLFILKEEGVYRLSGDSFPFIISLFDSSTILKAPDSAAVLNNQIYMYSSQGVATINDTGISVISRPIEDLLIKLTKSTFTSFSKATWGVSYESDRSYYLNTVTDITDTKATQCFRYNVFTNTWTLLPIEKNCGIVNPADDKLYFGAADTNFIEQERKSFDRTDYADREFNDVIAVGDILGTSVLLPSVSNYEAGDILVQEQYLTLAKFNRLLIKLDNDNGVNDTDYYSLLGGQVGINLRDSLDDLATKLDADSGVNDTDYLFTISGYGLTFQDIQNAFNDIIDKLNLDIGVSYINYQHSEGTVTFEVRITDVSDSLNQITVESATPFSGIAGPITIYKHINTEVQWAPEKMGDVSLSKHAREATLIFESTTFSMGTMSISSDLVPGFTSIDFEADGNGTYGNSTYGENSYGGTGTAVPFRTLIPRDNQRCRFLNLKFNHGIARQLYSLYGYSVTAEIQSERAFKQIS